MRRLISLGLLGAALSAGLVLVVQPAAKEQKIKMVKTFSPSRGKPWTYALKKDGETVSSNTIKNDREISFIPDQTQLEVCPASGRCVSATLTKDYAATGKQIAIDRTGAISPKTASEIKKAIADSQMVEVMVLIPVHKIKVPATLRSGTETAQYDKKSITKSSSKVASVEIPGVGQQISFSKPKVSVGVPGEKLVADEKLAKEEHYRIKIKVPTDSELFYLSINKGPLKRVKMRAGDKIDKNTVIRMGHGDEFFILNAPQPTADSY